MISFQRRYIMIMDALSPLKTMRRMMKPLKSAGNYLSLFSLSFVRIYNL